MACFGAYYSAAFGTANATYILTQSTSNSCQWTVTIPSPIKLLKYFADGCTGIAVDVSGTMTLTVTLQSPYSGVKVIITDTEGHTFQLFGGSYPFNGCIFPYTLYNSITSAGCGGTSDLPQSFLGYAGSAIITPCGSGGSGTCADIVLANTGQYLNDLGDSSSSSAGCDIDAVWTYNGGLAYAPAVTWFVYGTSNTDSYRWIGTQCDGHGQDAGLANFNSMTFTIPTGVDLSTFQLTGFFCADNWMDTIAVNSTAVDIGNFSTASFAYGTVTGFGSVKSYCDYTGYGLPDEDGSLNPFTLPSSAPWIHGTNTVLFANGNSDDFGGILVVWNNPCGSSSSSGGDMMIAAHREAMPPVPAIMREALRQTRDTGSRGDCGCNRSRKAA